MKNDINFEAALSGLDSAVRRLESGELTLDESIATFEEAVRLIGVCQKRLDDAEQRIRILTESSDGSITDAPFSVADDET